jgi:hypothetical protein
MGAALGFLAFAASGLGAQGYEIGSFGGTSPGDEFGRAVAGVGDWNGDGFADVAVGAPHASPGGLAEQGQVQVISGASGGILLALVGVSSGDRFGAALAGAGDLDGDGVADLLVGAPEASPGGASGAGRAIVISGANGSAILVLAGTGAGDRFGAALAGAGDLTGDGVPDLLVGSPGADAGGLSSAGEARVHSGANGAQVLLSSGVAPGDFFGSAVSAAGDVDGDGTLDVLVGAPQFGFLAPAGPGYVRAISGSSGTTILALNGSSVGDRFGASVAGGEDLDGDGFPEVVVGATFASPAGVAFAGTATVFSGANVLYSLAGPHVGANLGVVAFAGDANADGVADVVAGAQHAAGTGRAIVLSGADGSVLFVAAGDEADDHFGSSVAAAGDVNGDGFEDAIVGAHEAAPGGLPLAGEAKVVSYVGIPPGAISFGGGCPGSGGLVPLVQAGGGFPFAGAGNPGFVVVISSALGGAIATLVLGASSLSPPLDLGSLGVAGCSLHVSPDILLPAVASGAGIGVGFASVAVPVPSDPALAGAHVFVQWYVADPGPAAVPGAMSGAVDLAVLP